MKRYCRVLIILFTSVLCSLNVTAQDAGIFIQNKSFEGKPQAAVLPPYWTDGGFVQQSPSDTQPGFFGVDLPPSEGESYVGMVTREDGTWECIYQQLLSPMEKNKCYRFSIDIAFFPYYRRRSADSIPQAGYNRPVEFRIWGSNNLSQREDLLAISSPIDHANWRKYTFDINPDDKYNHLVFEAYYTDDQLNYVGNLLLDNMSDLQEIDCRDAKLQDMAVEYDQLISRTIDICDDLIPRGLYEEGIHTGKKKPETYQYLKTGLRVVKLSEGMEFRNTFSYFYELATLVKRNGKFKLILGLKKNTTYYPSDSERSHMQKHLSAALMAFGLDASEFRVENFKNKRKWMITNKYLGIRFERRR